jgi:hypothetical protein
MGVFLNKETMLEHYQEILLFASNVAENSLLKSNKLSQKFEMDSRNVGISSSCCWFLCLASFENL